MKNMYKKSFLNNLKEVIEWVQQEENEKTTEAHFEESMSRMNSNKITYTFTAIIK